MTDLSNTLDSTLNSFVDNCDNGYDSSGKCKFATIIDFNLKENETPVYFRGVAEEKRFYKAIDQMSLADTFRIQKKLLINAFHNKDIIINYLKLYNSLIENDITEEEFEGAIESNPDKYFINTNTNEKINFLEVEALNELVNELGENLSVQDVSETFSIDLSEIINYVKGTKSLPNG